MKDPSSKGQKNLKSWFASKFTYDFIEKVARDTGFLQRKRKLDPVYLLFVLIFGISIHQKPTTQISNPQRRKSENIHYFNIPCLIQKYF